jgi:uncharacterized protein (TIGR03083 family)
MTQTAATSVWPIVHAERRALLRDLSSLSPDDFATPSLCPGWSVHDVLAHLVESARTTRLGFVRQMIAARGDFDRANELGIARERRADPRQTLGSYAALLDATRSAPAAPATRLVEAFVHGEDIRRPLGIVRRYPVDAVADALAHQLRTGVPVGGGKERGAGLRVVATDAGREFGEGPAVTGAAIDLLLAVSGRSALEGTLSGEGAATLLERS